MAATQIAAEVESSIPSLAQWVKGSNVAAAVAQIQSLAWESPYATGAAIKKKRVYLTLTLCWEALNKLLALIITDSVFKESTQRA